MSAVDRFSHLNAWHCGVCGTLASIERNVVRASCECGSLCSPSFAGSMTRSDLIEPVPDRWDFERPTTDGDLSFMTAKDALDRLGWRPGLNPVPLLVVHPGGWYVGEGVVDRVRAEFEGRIAIHHEQFGDDDNWFIAWRGRRCGSFGA